MHTLVSVLMLLVILATMLKMTFLKRWQTRGFALLCAAFVALSWPWAIEQSRLQIESWLANRRLMLDTSVLLTIEVACQMSYAILEARLLDTGDRAGRPTMLLYRLLRAFPGLLIFPVLFAAEVSAIYALPGTGFAAVAWTLAAVTLVILSCGSAAVKMLLPEKELRLEMFFLLNAVIMMLGIICTVNGTPHYGDADAIEWLALAVSVMLMLLCACIGYVAENIKTRKYKNI